MAAEKLVCYNDWLLFVSICHSWGACVFPWPISSLHFVTVEERVCSHDPSLICILSQLRSLCVPMTLLYLTIPSQLWSSCAPITLLNDTISSHLWVYMTLLSTLPPSCHKWGTCLFLYMKSYVDRLKGINIDWKELCDLDVTMQKCFNILQNKCPRHFKLPRKEHTFIEEVLTLSNRWVCKKNLYKMTAVFLFAP